MNDYIFTAQEVADAITLMSTLDPKHYDLAGWEREVAAWYKLVACRKQGGNFIITQDNEVKFVKRI